MHAQRNSVLCKSKFDSHRMQISIQWKTNTFAGFGWLAGKPPFFH